MTITCYNILPPWLAYKSVVRKVKLLRLTLYACINGKESKVCVDVPILFYLVLV